ncbi:hypothetical protein WUBG_10440, partial [Wuchereria bancrofti]
SYDKPTICYHQLCVSLLIDAKRRRILRMIAEYIASIVMDRNIAQNLIKLKIDWRLL